MRSRLLQLRERYKGRFCPNWANLTFRMQQRRRLVNPLEGPSSSIQNGAGLWLRSLKNLQDPKQQQVLTVQAH